MKHVSEVGAAPEGARLPLNVHFHDPELSTTCDELETLPVFFVAAQSHTELPVIGLSSNYFSVAPEFPHFLLRAEAANTDLAREIIFKTPAHFCKSSAVFDSRQKVTELSRDV